MAVLTFELSQGLKTDTTTHREVGLRELTAGDYIDAQLAAEKVQIVNNQPVAYTSNVLMGLEMLCRQIDYIGEIQGPFSIKQLRKLHPDDFGLIQQKCDELDQVLAQELASRGRNNGAGGTK